TLQVVPTADAYVDSASASATFGGSSILSVNSARAAYLRFTVNGIGTRQVVRAALRLQVDGSSAAASPAGGTVHTISNGTWGERTITAKSRPLVDGPAFGSVGAVKPGQVVEFDLTGAVTGDGTYDLALVSPSADNANYRSRETLTPPKLVLALSGNAPIVAITAPPNQAVFPLGAAVAFTGVATDVEDGDVSPGLQWTSSLDGDLGTGARLSSSSLRVGTHTITAAATDSNGHPGQARLAVRVRGPNAAPAVTITAAALHGNGHRRHRRRPLEHAPLDVEPRRRPRRRREHHRRDARDRHARDHRARRGRRRSRGRGDPHRRDPAAERAPGRHHPGARGRGGAPRRPANRSRRYGPGRRGRRPRRPRALDLESRRHARHRRDADRAGARAGRQDAHRHGHRPVRRRRRRQRPRQREPLGAGLRPRGRYLRGCRDAHQGL